MADLRPLRARVALLLKAAPAAARDVPGTLSTSALSRSRPPSSMPWSRAARLDRATATDGLKASCTGHAGPGGAVLGRGGQAALSLGSAHWVEADRVDLHLVLGDDTLVSTLSVDGCSQSMHTVTGRGDPARVKQALDLVCEALERHPAPLRWKA